MSASIRPSWALPTAEIGGASRSANRTQGTGAAENKGSQLAPMETISGDKATKDLFENLDITWNRLPGGAAVGEIVKQALDSFVPARPEALLPQLAKARPLIAAIVAATKDPLAERKLKELDETIALCSGLSLEAQSDKAAVSPGATLRVNFTAVQRLPNQVALTGISLSGIEGAPTVNLAPTILANNQPSRYNASFTIPQNQPYTQPYWLAQPKDGAALFGPRSARHRTARKPAGSHRAFSRASGRHRTRSARARSSIAMSIACMANRFVPSR